MFFIKIIFAVFGFYDFIIVGGGTAGAVIANRLSEENNWKILVLEAGGYENDYTDIPALYYLLGKTKYNWGYNTTPQKTQCQGKKNNNSLY